MVNSLLVDSYKVSHTKKYEDATVPEKHVLSVQDIRDEFGKLQQFSRELVEKVYKHISSQSSEYNGRWQNPTSSRYHGELANDCQAVINTIPHSLDKEYKAQFKALFIELEKYFRDCLIEDRRLAAGPETYKTWKRRIDALW